MNQSTSQKDFLLNDVIPLLNKLKPDTEPNFGLMTAQHMVEHLSWTMKSCVKRIGEVENPPTKGQLGFKRFIDGGAIFEHRPSGKTKDDLPSLRFNNMEEAIEQVEVAIKRFYDHFENQPDFKCYNKFFGELNFSELELFNHNHYRYHLWQFGLIEKFL